MSPRVASGPCIFCQIAGAELAAERVAESESAVAFLDTRPVFLGHVLVVPRAHAETLGDLGPAVVGPFFTFVQKVTGAVERGTQADGSFVAMNNRVSQSVPHLHVHVVPRKKKDGLKGFFWPRQKYASLVEMHAMADRIRASFDDAVA